MTFWRRKRVRLAAALFAVVTGLSIFGAATANADNPTDTVRDQSDVQPDVIGGNPPTQTYTLPYEPPNP